MHFAFVVSFHLASVRRIPDTGLISDPHRIPRNESNHEYGQSYDDGRTRIRHYDRQRTGFRECRFAARVCDRNVAPEYYRFMFRIPPDANFNVQQLGLGLGATQGLAAGLVVGLVVVLATAWYGSRVANIAR